MNGSAYAQVISYLVYNFVRFEFLRRKFGMQPFNKKTLYSILIAIFAFAASYLLFRSLEGWTAIILRSLLFSTILIAGVFYFQLTPDALQLYFKFKERWSKQNKAEQ